ncbi:MAG TPA: hypothetical protein PKW55_01710 [Spirochaetota bacterium]|nr:hypothetical protein [Spirochaetota bacterium]HOM38989.1 hypothetical protein [Spirochaetota bacterium]HPQ48352.1 hypothetical protein [Spirochaetota bacterium]
MISTRILELWYDIPSYFMFCNVIEPSYYNSIINRGIAQTFNKFLINNFSKPIELLCLLSEDVDYDYVMNQEELMDYNKAQMEKIMELKAYLDKRDNKDYSIDEVFEIWAKNYSVKFRKYWHLKKVISLF